MEAGINPTSDGRLQEMMKETTISPELALRELENKKKQAEMMSSAANARNPYNDPSRSTAQVVQRLEGMDADDRYIAPYQRADKFDPYSQLGFTPAPGHDLTPMQAQIHN